jgi:3-phenylpropionate/trans-cinnamate dioxygenase ferredoxin component
LPYFAYAGIPYQVLDESAGALALMIAWSRTPMARSGCSSLAILASTALSLVRLVRAPAAARRGSRHSFDRDMLTARLSGSCEEDFAMPIHSVCRSDELAIGQMKVFAVGGHKLVLYHLTDGFFATQASCTHVFAPLARGKIIADSTVQCPFHRARFDIRTGQVTDWANFPPGIQLLNVVRREKALQTFEVNVTDGNVQVNIPTT